MKWRNSLVFHFWFALNGIVLIAVLTISGLYLWRESTHLEDSIKNEGITAANTLNSAIGLYMLQEKYSQISPLTYSLQSEPNIAYVIIKDKEGITVNQKGNTTIDKDKIMVEKVPLEYFQENVGEVEIALKIDKLEKQKRSLVFDTIITVLIFSFISLILSYYVSKKLSLPIKKLITATKQFTEGKRNIKVLEKKSVVEIEQLATAFNQMSETIDNHEKILVSEINKATKDLSEKVSILEVLGNISNSVMEDDIQSIEVVKVTLQSIKKYIHADWISYAISNKEGYLEIFDLDVHNTISPFELGQKDGSIQTAINNKEIIIRNHLNTQVLSHYEEILIQKGMKSLLILPVIAKNRVIGTLNIASSVPDYFSKEIVDKLSPFTNQIALALDRIAAYESLQDSAYHDFLTGLPNYRLFKIRIMEALERAKEQKHLLGAVMFIDLDRFKMVNDTFDHATGDLLLKHISQLLSNSISSEDTVSRYGGDEFSILLPNIKTKEEAASIAKNILDTLEQPIFIKDYEIMISASIGIAFYPENGEDPDTLLKNADRAMYRVKNKEKKNFAIYAQHKDDLSKGDLILENDLRKGLERKEFVVYYQPKVNTQSGIISGAEALIRWIHPEKGLIPPGDFIPLAEETGLIISIGEFVLREAAKQAVVWQYTNDTSIPISVNLSTRQFFQPTLVSDIGKIIKETGINPELLELEITESMSMDIEKSLGILLDLKKLGVQISVDDFGTGYSSLNYLRQLPIDRVKIDKSFINDMTVDENDAAIVASIINMSHNLKLSVIAEGVETEEQLKYLQKYDCDEIQGYYYSKPIPIGDFEKKYINNLGEQ